ncbi:hypothetical protein HVIM_04567 (plasmid) [Roseomonas mucosa]|uniref:hypothetical protein n=1 Tax=Roseomonas mucosa TaxID=207340 RepID=UPI0024CA33E5|nr:hypothetical protein [Roseomonas mucosa]QDD92660.1 hypothetical protein HVIM_04567 [Roseomonas mucosa]
MLDIWTLAEALAASSVTIPATAGGGDLGSFLPDTGREAVSVLRQRLGIAGTFLAALEMTKQGVFALEQDAAFASIHLRASG